MAPNRPMTTASSTVMRPVGAQQHRLQGHAEDGGGAGHQEVPVRPDDHGRLVEHDIAEQAAAERDSQTDDDHAKHVDVAAPVPRREERALEAAKPGGEQLDPQRDLELRDVASRSASPDGSAGSRESREPAE